MSKATSFIRTRIYVHVCTQRTLQESRDKYDKHLFKKMRLLLYHCIKIDKK